MALGTPNARLADDTSDPDEAIIDQVFFALSDPVRRRILEQLDTEQKLVSELAAPFDISLQAVSRHIQVLVRAGLVRQERTGRISRCSLVAGPIFPAAVWLNRYSKYWHEQFGMLAMALEEIVDKGSRADKLTTRRRRRVRTTNAGTSRDDGGDLR